MKQRPIGFRELLERVLPLAELPPADRLRVQRALSSGVAAQIEQAAYQALSQLERAGALRRLPATHDSQNAAVRYQPRERPDVITVYLANRQEHEGFAVYPRMSLPAQAQAGLDQVRRLLRLDDPFFSSDPRSGQTRLSLLNQFERAGRELLAASEVHLVPAEPLTDGMSGAPMDPALAAEVRSHPNAIYYCPDTAVSRVLRMEAERRRLRSVVMVGVTSSEEEVLGHLEVGSAERDAFTPDDLALVALLADTCGGVLERVTRIEKLVFIDPLTGIYNRSYFDLQVQNEMARALRERAAMALCIADIDDFKSFNTAFGYQAGNQVLIQVAQALKHGVRPFDTVARWGGEEFAVLLTAPVHSEDVLAVSERLRTTVERTVLRLEGLDRRAHRVGVTVSLGVALYPDHADNPQDLWRVANQALLKAKRPPKNQVVFYEREGDPRFHAG